ncbi:MAG: DUF177 domain-containing protein [Peptostreptococcaceae bacterium]|nr:DUF177 domain-containing protein [Peptostreptococcaceae bacterium]
MEISVRELSVGNKSLMSFTHELPISSWTMNEREFSFLSNPLIEGNLRRRDGRIYGEFVVKISLKEDCSRCLMPASSDYICEIRGYLMQEEEETDDLDDDIILVEDFALRLEHILDLALLEDLPAKVICSEDCRGLCPDCGANLNQTQCSCEASAPRIDSRLERLRELM